MLRSQGYVETTAAKCGMRPLSKLGLRPLLHSREQRVYTALLLSTHQALLVPRLTPPPMWQNLGRAAWLKSLLPLTAHSRRLSSIGLLKKKLMLTRGVASDATKPLVVSQDPPKEKEVPSTMEVVLATLLLPAKGDLKSKT